MNTPEPPADVAEIDRLRSELDHADHFGRGEFRVTSWAYEQVCRTDREKGEKIADLMRQVAELRAGAVPDTGQAPAALDAAHFGRQAAFSSRTFGPGPRTEGVLDHIRKELLEIEANPSDLGEWVDVMILAADGAWRAGHDPQAIVDAVIAKQAKNEARVWPDWRTAESGKAIEHDRSADTGQAREPAAPDEDAIRAADLCHIAAWVVANPQGAATWLNSVPSLARQHLATWLRTEEVLFRTDAGRGSPIGFPSWHFAQTVGTSEPSGDTVQAPESPTDSTPKAGRWGSGEAETATGAVQAPDVAARPPYRSTHLYRTGELVNLADDLLRLDSMVTAAPADYPGLPHLRRERDAVAAEIDRSGVAALIARVAEIERRNPEVPQTLDVGEIRDLLGTDTTPDRLAWISKAGETAAAERQAREPVGFVIGRLIDATAQHGDRTLELWDDDVHRTLNAAEYSLGQNVDDPDPWPWRIFALAPPPGPSGDTVQAPDVAEVRANEWRQRFRAAADAANADGFHAVAAHLSELSELVRLPGRVEAIGRALLGTDTAGEKG